MAERRSGQVTAGCNGRWRPLVALVLLGVMLPQTASALVIDAFDSGDSFTLENVGFGTPSINQPANVLGGTRTVFTVTRVEFNPTVGLDLTHTVIASQAEVNFGYDGGGADLTADGADRFVITLDLLQLPASSSFDVLVLVNGSQFALPAGGSFTLPPPQPGPSFGMLEAPFAPFADSLELRNVERLNVQFRLQSNIGQSVRIVDFRTVPEPGGVVLLAAGVGASCLLRGQRRK